MMTQSGIFWKQKILALLHDPLTKALDIQGHEEAARRFSQAAKVIHDRGREDIIASAFDRVPLPLERTAEQLRIQTSEIYYVHPISGEKTEKFPSIPLESTNEKIEKSIASLREENKLDDEKFYHALWWEIGNFTDYDHILPADTRTPNHSILDHIDLTAAIAATEETKNELKPALLSFQIGPVQEVISQARKVIDLWAGSYLLSHLIYKAIETIGLTLGFDTIIYPYLRGNPFVYKTLKERGVQLNSKPITDEKVASLPNIFLAIVPENRAGAIAEECKRAVIDEWKRLVRVTKEYLQSKERDRLGLHNFEEYEYQAELFPTITYDFVRLPAKPEEVEKDISTYFKDEVFHGEVKEYLNFLQEVKSKGGYSPNEGSFYRFVYKILTARLTAKKQIRAFKSYYSDRTIGSDRIPDDFGGGVRACVEIIDKQESESKSDYLGTLNTVKRLLKDTLGFKSLKFESTEDVALANDVNNQNGEVKMRNGYIGVLVMDGDNMGKLVSGEFALTADKILHEKASKAMERTLSHDLTKLRMFTPAYQRNISRTLALFASFVRPVVEEKYKGMLVYAGGDDILAILPADKVIPCANDIRKIYVGQKLSEPLEIDGSTYKFKDGFAYRNGKLYAPMMGSATISAGISIVNHKMPLQVAINLARETLKYAKSQLGKDSFAIHVVRRSGQAERFGSKWIADGIDVIDRAYEILELSDKLNLSTRSLYKIRPDDLRVVGRDNIDKLVNYVLRRSEVKKEPEVVYEELKEKLIAYFKTLYIERTSENGEDEQVLLPVKLLLTIRLTKRGDER